MAKINKAELLSAFKADMRAAETMQKDWLQKRAVWINETHGRPYGNETKGKSAIVSKDIKKQLEWQLPSLADPFLSTPDVIKCNPITYEDVEAARQNELLLNTQFCRKFPRYNFIMKSLRVLATEGTLIVQTGWDYEDEEVEIDMEVVEVDDYGTEYIDVQSTKVTKVLRNQPTAVVCRNEDIFLDPTCMDDIDKCQFVIHRYETDMSTLKADGRYKNLDKIQSKGRSGFDSDYRPEDLTNFRFKDDARRKLMVHEYWGNYDIDGDGIVEQVVCAWIDDTIIRLQTNPYPDKKPPFIIVPFNAVPFQLFGEALAENIGDNQKVKTAITRGFIDNMAKSNNGQIGMRKGALDGTNRKRFLTGDNFEFNGTPSDFWQGSYNQIPGSTFDIMQLMNNEIESQTGVKSFSGGINAGSLGGTAAGARGALDASATRRLNLVRNIAENLMKPLMRKWMSYNSEFLEEEEIVRITNKEYVPVRRDDLAGAIDIDIAISTAEDNAAKAQELSFMMQTLGNSMPFEMTQMLMAKFANLSRMPDLEQAIAEYKPQPDPAQEQMKQMEMRKMQMEIEKLKADIADKYARADENMIDAEVKRNKAAVEAAKARKLGSEADRLDLDFLKDDEGYKESLDFEKEMRDKRHQMELVMAQARAKDTNIGIGR
ncbi:MAG: cell envelope integrity protein TolA [Sulfuricurvum sp.]